MDPALAPTALAVADLAIRRHGTYTLVGVVVLVVVLLVVAVPAVLIGRGRAKRMIAASEGQPFAYGQPMTPAPGGRSFPVDVVGLPGVVTVSMYTPLVARVSLDPMRIAGQAYMDEPPGRVHVKVPLGPDWPRISVMFRAGGQQIGTALARSMGTAGHEILTGDPTFDATYRVAAAHPDPRPVLAVLNPEIRATILGGRVQRWQVGGGMWLETGYFRQVDEQACVAWSIALAARIVVTSGIPVVRPGSPPPPPPGYGGGAQVPG